MTHASLPIAQALTQSATRLQDLVTALDHEAPESAQRAALRTQVDAEIVAMKQAMQLLRAALDGTPPRTAT